MFFIFGIDNRSKPIEYLKTIICLKCGAYGRYQITMTYMCFSLFFIPVWRWNRQYFVTMSCCNAVYCLDREIGKALARGEQVDIKDQDLTLVREGSRSTPEWSLKKTCSGCGYEMEEAHLYCPKCGMKY